MRLCPRRAPVRSMLAAAAVLLLAGAACQTQDTAGQQPTLEQLYEDGNALADLANLGLTAEQLRKLEAHCRAHQAAVQGLEAKRNGILKRVQPQLQQRLQLLLAGQACPEDVLAAIDMATVELEELEVEASDARAELGRGVSQVLNAAQKQALTGQTAATGAAEALDGVRAMSAADFEQEGRMMAELLVESAAAEPRLDTDSVLDIFREARTLTEKQYREQRDAFVAPLLPLFSLPSEDVEASLAGRFAYARMADLLAQRLARMEAGAG